MDNAMHQKAERTYNVRSLTHPKVQKALKMEQIKRHSAVQFNGPEPRKEDILADWVEEKADAIIGSDAER